MADKEVDDKLSGWGNSTLTLCVEECGNAITIACGC